MLSRALNLATVTLLIGCLTAVAVHAVENLEAGKSPSQIFASTCNVCHKSPRGLLKTVPSSSLSGFLRQHYTTSSDMANVLASFLISNGAADQRFQAKDQPKQKDGAKDPRQEAATRPGAQQPDPRQNDPRQRLPRPGEVPDVMRPDHGPAQAAIDAKQNLKQRGKKGRPAEEPKVEEPTRTEPTEAPKSETAKTDTKTDDSAKPDSKTEPKSETAKVDAPKESVSEPPATRPDPVPQVSPAPATAAPGSTTASSAPPPEAAPTPTLLPPPPAVAAAPALPPVAPAGPPAVPISQ